MDSRMILVAAMTLVVISNCLGRGELGFNNVMQTMIAHLNIGVHGLSSLWGVAHCDVQW